MTCTNEQFERAVEFRRQTDVHGRRWRYTGGKWLGGSPGFQNLIHNFERYELEPEEPVSELIEQLQETLRELRESEARIVFDQKLPVSVPQYQQIEEEYNLAIEHISLLESLVREAKCPNECVNGYYKHIINEGGWCVICSINPFSGYNAETGKFDSPDTPQKFCQKRPCPFCAMRQELIGD